MDKPGETWNKCSLFVRTETGRAAIAPGPLAPGGAGRHI